jgi:hypothetical protein
VIRLIKTEQQKFGHRKKNVSSTNRSSSVPQQTDPHRHSIDPVNKNCNQQWMWIVNERATVVCFEQINACSYEEKDV